jgi:hypothetical protein
MLKIIDGVLANGASQVPVPSGALGGILIAVDGTNAATVVIKAGDSNGKIIFSIISYSPIFIVAPVWCEGKQQIYASCTGTSAGLSLYEWVP